MPRPEGVVMTGIPSRSRALVRHEQFEPSAGNDKGFSLCLRRLTAWLICLGSPAVRRER